MTTLSTPQAPTEPPARSDGVLKLGWLSCADPRAVTTLMIGVIVVGGLVAGVGTAFNPLIGAGAILLIGGSLLLLRRLELGGLVLVTFVPTLSGLRPGLPVPSLKITEILIAGIAVLALATIRRTQTRPWTRIEWSLFVFVLVSIGFGVFDAVNIHEKLSRSDIGTLIGPLQFFLLYRSVRLLMPTRRLQLAGLRILLYTSVPLALIGIAQQLNVPSVRSLIVNITASYAVVGAGYLTFTRASSLWPQWTLFSGYLAVIIVLGVAAMLEREMHLLPRRHLYGILILDGVALLLTAELSAIAGLTIALVLLAWWSKRLGLLLKTFGVILIVLGTAAGPYIAARVRQEYNKTVGSGATLVPQTIQYRWAIWTDQYFPAIGERPVTGWGVYLPPVIVWPAPESQYVLLMMRGGAPTLVAYLIMWGSVGSAAACLRRDPEHPIRRVTGRAVLALVLILVPMNLVFPYVDDSGLPQPFWVLVAVMMATVPARLPPIGLGSLPGRRKAIASATTLALSRRDRDALADGSKTADL